MSQAGDGTDPDLALAEDTEEALAHSTASRQVSALHECPAADDLLRLDEGAVDDGVLAVLEADLGAGRVGAMPPVATMTPALIASSTNCPSSRTARTRGLGGKVGSSAKVYPRNRIPCSFL